MILKNIIRCDDSELKTILGLRNLLSIRENMFTDHEITWDEHKDWIQRLNEDKKNLVFTVNYSNQVVGLVSINNMNHKHKTSDWAFYLSPDVQGKGIGAVLEFTMLELVFNELKFEKLNCQVFSFNEPVIKMHEKFGFLKEGEIRAQILKSQGRINVVHLGITKNEWLANRENKVYVLERYGEQVRIID